MRSHKRLFPCRIHSAALAVMIHSAAPAVTAMTAPAARIPAGRGFPA